MSRLVKASRSPAVTPLERARRQSERGDQRRAMMILREACFAAESDASLWVHYGLACLRAGRREDAFGALAQAVWLRERARDHARAAVTRDIMVHLKRGDELPMVGRRAA
jgi:Flp pilus assembly protein TadD